VTAPNSLKVATFNVNSARAREANIIAWLNEFKPDVALLQEIKCQDEQFPREGIEAMGYHIETKGQKAYNGVAILSKYPIDQVVTRVLPGDDDDDHARYLEVDVAGMRLASLYLPNGNPAPGPKFDYKLAWMDRLIARTTELLSLEIPFVLAGDYNVAPTDLDVYDPRALANDALGRPESKDRLQALKNLGLVDAFRVLHPYSQSYSYWDYQAGAYQKDNGWRIDFLMCSPQAADRLVAADIDRAPRAKEKASDHTPAWAEFSLV